MPAEPTSVRWLPAGSLPEAELGGASDVWRAFEFTSRGDRVVARVHVPPGAKRCALALVASADASAVGPGDGFATATLDLPLLGLRRSPKWTVRLRACLTKGPESATDCALLDEFLAQSAADLRAVLDVCLTLREIDDQRVGLVGIGPGAAAGAALQQSEPRLRAFVLCAEGLCGELDPGDTAGADADPGIACGALIGALA